MSGPQDWFEIVTPEGEGKDATTKLKDKIKKQQKPESEGPPRFTCPNGGFATILVCADCKDREPVPGDFCPSYPDKQAAEGAENG